MRLFCFLIILLVSGLAFAEGEAQAPPAAESRSCVSPDPQDGACPHPAFIYDAEAQVCRFETLPVSREHETKCLSLAKPYAARRGKQLRLTLRNGAAKTYRDTLEEKDCNQSPAGCWDYILYDWFPEHRLFLVNKSVEESDEWMLVSQLNGREEEIIAPPHYSPDRKWLAAVYYWTHGADAESGIDIVPAALSPALPPFHYRPKGRALLEFVRWDGSDRLVTKVTVGGPPDSPQPPETFPVDVVRENGAWRLKWPRPAPPP
jgi:hypothetical protein